MGGWRGPHEAKGAQGVIKRDQLSFCFHLSHLQTNTHLFTLLFSESTSCLATSLSCERFNLYFGGPSVPALGGYSTKIAGVSSSDSQLNQQCRGRECVFSGQREIRRG